MIFKRLLEQVSLEKYGYLSTEYNLIKQLVDNPIRKDKNNKKCNILTEVRKDTLLKINNDNSLKGFHKEANKRWFDWTKIKEWIIAHLPQILQVISILISIFIFL